MKPDGKRQGKRNKEQSRRTDPGGWKALGQWPAREQRDGGHSQHEKKKSIVHWRQTPHEARDRPQQRQSTTELVAGFHGREPLQVDNKQSAGRRPVTIRAVTNRISQREILKQREKHDQYDGERHDGSR